MFCASLVHFLIKKRIITYQFSHSKAVADGFTVAELILISLQLPVY